MPVLFAVDRYNALYAPSAYGKTVNEHSRRMLTVDELRLGRAMRILEHPSPANGMSIAALARGDRLSRRMPVCRMRLYHACHAESSRPAGISCCWTLTC